MPTFISNAWETTKHSDDRTRPASASVLLHQSDKRIRLLSAGRARLYNNDEKSVRFADQTQISNLKADKYRRPVSARIDGFHGAKRNN